MKYWRKVLFIVVSVVKFLCISGLAFRGKNKLIGSISNGNYLGILTLLSEYDAFLAEHIRVHASKGRDYSPYLSSTICKEIIELVGQKVLLIVVDEIKRAVYFSVSI